MEMVAESTRRLTDVTVGRGDGNFRAWSKRRSSARGPTIPKLPADGLEYFQAAVQVVAVVRSHHADAQHRFARRDGREQDHVGQHAGLQERLMQCTSLNGVAAADGDDRHDTGTAR